MTTETDEPRPLAETLDERVGELRRQQAEAGDVFIPPADPEPLDPDAARAALRAAWVDRIPPRFADARLDSLPLTPTLSTIQAWCTSEATTNLVLVGAIGTGKTWTATAAARCRFGRGESVAWWRAVDLLDALRPGGDPVEGDYARRVGVLVLDDLAAHKSTDWTDEQLYAIVDHRWSHQLPVIATTNVEPDNAGDAMDGRLYSRLFGDDAVVVKLTGPDRRFRP